MSVRYSITHIESVAGAEVHYRADLLDSEYEGSPIERRSTDRFFQIHYDELDFRDPYADPIRGGEVDVNIIMKELSDMDLIDDVIDSPETRFQIIFYIDDVEILHTNVTSDFLDYPEESLEVGIPVEIGSKYTPLLDSDYPMYDTNSPQPIIRILAECLEMTGIDRPIRTYTNLTHLAVDQQKDFLEEFILYRRHLKNYGRGDEDDTAMTCREVIDNICRRFNLIMRQAAGYWNFYQLPAIARGDAIEFEYDSEGVFVGDGQPQDDQAVEQRPGADDDAGYLTVNSRNRVSGALKRIISPYNHRTLISSFPFGGAIEHTVESDRTSESVEVDEAGTFRLVVDAFARVQITENYSPQSGDFAHVRIRGIREGTTDLIWDNESRSWDDGAADHITPIPVFTSIGDELTGSVSGLETRPVPADVESVEVEFGWASVAGYTVSSVRFEDLNIRLVSGDPVEDSASITYSYERAGNYTVKDEMDPVIFGQGPTPFSPGAIRYITQGTFRILGDGFRLRGETENLSLEELMMRERMNTRRSGNRRLGAELIKKYDGSRVIAYQQKRWFFLGGSWAANGAVWDANIWELKYETEEDELFRILADAADGASGGGQSAEDFRERTKENAIGFTTDRLDGFRTSIPVELSVKVRKGNDYLIALEFEEDPIPITPTADAGPGKLDLAIEEQLIVAPEGSYIVREPSQEEAEDIVVPGFDYAGDSLKVVDGVLEAALDLIQGTMDDLKDGIAFQRAAANSLNEDGIPLLEQAIGDLDDLDDGQDFAKVTSSSLTEAGLVLLSASVGNLDDIDDGTNSGKVNKANLSAEGLVLLEGSVGDLDDIDDGVDWQRVKSAQLTADGLVLLSQASGDMDDIDDGTEYGRILSTSISAGKIRLSEGVGDLDDIDDGSNFSKVSSTSISSGNILLAQTIGDIDDLDDGSTYGRVRATDISAGHIRIVGENGATVIDQGQITASDLRVLTANISGWDLGERWIRKTISGTTGSHVHITSQLWSTHRTLGAGVFFSQSEISNGDIRCTHVGQLHIQDTVDASSDYGFEVIQRTGSSSVKHLVRMGGGDFFLTNAGNDFRIDKNGVGFAMSTTDPATDRGITWGDHKSSLAEIISPNITAYSGGGMDRTLHLMSQRFEFYSDTNADQLMMRMKVEGGTLIFELPGLRTSPSGNDVWQDSNGFLRIGS